MFSEDQYALVEFGQARKWERFGPYVLDRPCPAATAAACTPPPPDARFERLDADPGEWRLPKGFPGAWTVRHGGVTFELKPTPFGHVGMFPEQAENWDWLAEQVARRRAEQADMPCQVLNLFAYTGGSTLSAAAAGASVAHVDAAASSVAWARRNAELSGLASAPVRWIVEDARKFVARETRRGRRYQGIILDPPGYGHGPSGQAWKLLSDLPPLLQDCAGLLDAASAFVLLTCHETGITPIELAGMLREAGLARGEIESGELALRSRDGRTLNSGIFARCG